jgi:endonuclease/exonuclease/phosphatase family metal-dependent hydrolase
LYLAILVLALTGLAACQTSQNLRTDKALPETGAGAPLTVMSYNIRLGIGGQYQAGSLYDMPWDRNLPAVIEEIRSVDPDIVGLQEVAGTHQAKTLSRALNMNYAYVGHETARVDGSWWGVAVLSKFPILKSRGVEISFGPGNQRTVIVATLDMGGRTATFLSVHKDKDLHDGSSIHAIMDIVAPIDGPVTLIGDFNFTPKKSKGRLETIAARFVDTAAAVQTQGARDAQFWGTFVRSKRRIDYVFSDPRHFTVADAGVTLPDKPASDHRAYFAKLRWK